MIEDLIQKQQALMLKVPHTVRPDALVKMCAGVRVIDTLLRFLNSTGHKPWRPVPLSPLVQERLLKDLKVKVSVLAYVHHTTAGAQEDFDNLEHYTRQLVSAYGVIEETLEYVNSLSDGSGRAHQLEEVVDILFFYMEQMILGGFTWEEIEREYHRKWAVNIKRYEDAKRGDYAWDERGGDSL